MASKQKIIDFLNKEVPHFKCNVLEVGNQSSLTKHHIGKAELRSGGTVSGPTLMAVADVALYVAILGEIGFTQDTATTSLNINFLRKPTGDKDIIAKCSLIKKGRTLVIGEVSLFSEDDDRPVAHVVGTYALLEISKK